MWSVDLRASSVPTMSTNPTRWSLVFRASAPDAAGRQALDELCRAYWPAVFAFYRAAVHDDERARDLTQGLFAHLLGRGDFASVAPMRGRFRHWLAACARHWLSDATSHDRAHKRGGGNTCLSIEAADDDPRWHEPCDPQATPERAYAQRWVAALVDRAMARAASEWRLRGRDRVFALARLCLDGEPPRSYEQLAAEVGTSEGAFKVAVHRLRDRVRELLVDEVRQTVDDPTTSGNEAGFLLAELAQGGSANSR